MNKEIAECVGLWLAEGDNKSNSEITFTNNEFSLVQFFHDTLTQVFSHHKFNVRIYIYFPYLAVSIVFILFCNVTH